MMNKMLPLLPIESLVPLLERLEFSDSHSDLQSGDEWSVRASIWPAATPDRFDAAIVVSLRGTSIPLDDLTVEIAPSPGDESAAIRTLPPPRTSKTDARGQAWFRDIEFGAWKVRLVEQA